jgi:hypothetical protein
MGKFLFDKSELTYNYLEKLFNIFVSYGLHAQAVPLIVFLRFYVKEILANNFMQILWDIKFYRLLL